MEQFRSWIYDKLIVSFTSQWYRCVLESLPDKAVVLDVGIGTGTALVRNSELVRAKGIQVVGVDYDQAYIAKCKLAIAGAGLQDQCSATYASIYDFHPDDGTQFDAVYFSGSFMILPDKGAALEHVLGMMKPDGKLLFTQTFELQKNEWLEWAKPKLSYWTSIDFGTVTYKEDFEITIASAGLSMDRFEVIQDGNAKPDVRQSMIAVASRTQRGS